MAFAYAALILVNATVLQSINDWVDWRDYPRGVIRAAGFSALGYGLLRRATWAWWTSVILGVLFVVVGVAGVVLVVVNRPAETDSVLPRFALPVAGVSLILIATLVVLLLLPGTRAAFRARVAPSTPLPPA